MRRFVVRFPGFAVLISAVQFCFIAFLLAVVYLNGKTIDNFYSSAEFKARSVFSSEVYDMAKIADTSDLLPEEKRLLLYGKAGAAVNALAETGYEEGLKRVVTEALNGICSHLLKGGLTDELLSADEIDFLHVFGEENAESAYRRYFSREKLHSEEIRINDQGIKGSAVGIVSVTESKNAANRLFGVSWILTEEKTPIGGTYLFTCKNAYALMDAVGNYPIAASISLASVGESVYTAEECVVFAKRFLEEAYPKRIYRRLTREENPAEISEGEAFCDVVFCGGGEEKITVRISRSSGRMIRLLSEGFREKM